MCFKKQKVLVRHIVGYTILQGHDWNSLEQEVLMFMEEQNNHGTQDYWEPLGGVQMIGPGEVVTFGQAMVKITFIFKEIP